jgi:hypothetical protein
MHNYPDYSKPDSYTDADWELVQGYLHGLRNLPKRSQTAAYKHGYENGVDDRTGRSRNKANVNIRRANMIPGITPMRTIG